MSTEVKHVLKPKAEYLKTFEKTAKELYKKTGVVLGFPHPEEFFTQAEADATRRTRQLPQHWEIEKVTTIREIVG